MKNNYGKKILPCHGVSALHRFVNTVAACLSGTDAVCMAILGFAALEWRATDKAEQADKWVIIIQLTVLVGEAFFKCFRPLALLSRSQ